MRIRKKTTANNVIVVKIKNNIFFSSKELVFEEFNIFTVIIKMIKLHKLMYSS